MVVCVSLVRQCGASADLFGQWLRWGMSVWDWKTLDSRECRGTISNISLIVSGRSLVREVVSRSTKPLSLLFSNKERCGSAHWPYIPWLDVLAEFVVDSLDLQWCTWQSPHWAQSMGNCCEGDWVCSWEWDWLKSQWKPIKDNLLE